MSQVACPQCGKLAMVTPQLQGRKVQCPCGCIHRMPGQKIDAAALAAAPASAAGNKPMVVSAPAPKVPVMCPQCFSTFQVGEDLLGKTIRTPCGHTFRAETTGPDPLAPVGGGGAFGFDNLSQVPQTANYAATPSYLQPPAQIGNPYANPESLPAYLRPGGVQSGTGGSAKPEYQYAGNSSSSGFGSSSTALNVFGGVILILVGLAVFGYLAYALYEWQQDQVEIRWRGVIGCTFLGCTLIGGGIRLIYGGSGDEA